MKKIIKRCKYCGYILKSIEEEAKDHLVNDHKFPASRFGLKNSIDHFDHEEIDTGAY